MSEQDHIKLLTDIRNMCNYLLTEMFFKGKIEDDTPIELAGFSTRVYNALQLAGYKTVSQVDKESDEILLSKRNLGKGGLAELRKVIAVHKVEQLESLRSESGIK